MAKWITEAERMLISCQLVESESRSRDELINPATEEVIGRAPAADRRDVDKAVIAAFRTNHHGQNMYGSFDC